MPIMDAAHPGPGENDGLVWTKSFESNSQNNCVEVAFGNGAVLVRHSRHRTGPRLSFTVPEWTAFLAGVLAGQFAPPDAQGIPAP